VAKTERGLPGGWLFNSRAKTQLVPGSSEPPWVLYAQFDFSAGGFLGLFFSAGK